MASTGGHHVPGTPYNWRHGWEPLNVATAVKYHKGPRVIKKLRGRKEKSRNYKKAALTKGRPASPRYKRRTRKGTGSGPLGRDIRYNQGDPLAKVDLTSLSDEQIADLAQKHADRPDVFDRLLGEMDRRDQAEHSDPWALGNDEPTAEEQRIAGLVAGRPARVGGEPRSSFAASIRRMDLLAVARGRRSHPRSAHQQGRDRGRD